MRSTDVVIIGAGAAGLMCAMTAAARGRQVLFIDHSNKAGKKILMSGGGRCNFTNMYADPANFFSQNPHFCKSALARYTPSDFIAMVTKHGVPYHEKKLGQLFCDNKSKDILNMLLEECRQAGVELHLNTSVREIEKTEAGYLLSTDMGPIASSSLVVATGGLSIPTLGATGFGYEIARQFGHTVLATRACLCRSPSAASSRSCAPSCPAHRWPAWSAATVRASARTSCSPIAASAARRSCRSPPSGTPAMPSRSTCCPTTTPWSRCKVNSPRAPTAS